MNTDDTLGLKIVWLSIGATLMALALVFLTFKMFARRDSQDPLDKEKQEESKQNKLKEDQGKLIILVIFIAFVSYVLMLITSLYSTQENVTIIRYIEWFITTPLLLIDLALIAHIAQVHLNYMIVLDLAMIALGLAAVFSSNLYMKYTLFALSTIAMILIFTILFSSKTKPVDISQKDLDKSFKANLFTGILWTLYPVVWILSNQGFNVLSIADATLGYMILDVLAKAVLGIVFLL